jgi:predicted Fe-Mo cluster-binding NifX family protein
LEDCSAVLVQRIGFLPQKKLEEKGIKVVQTIGRIDEEILKVIKRY